MRQLARVASGFNPPPVRKPEETGKTVYAILIAGSVSIRPQFANRRKLQLVAREDQSEEVSIRPQFANRRKPGMPSAATVDD